MTTLHTTISDIFLDTFDFSQLSAEEEIHTKHEMQEFLLKNTLLRVLDSVDDTTSEDFDSFLEINSDPKIIMDYMNNHLPGFNQTLEQEIQFLVNMGI